MREFDEELLKEVGRMTGYTGDKLSCVTGAICTTVFLGKMPIKEDLADYLGVSKHVLMETLKNVSVYPLATELSLRGLYVGVNDEPVERAIARSHLATMFNPTAVKTVKEYVGYDTTLEYLWRAVTGSDSDETIDDYTASRFESKTKISKKLQAFALIIYQQNKHLNLLSSDYRYICEVLADGARRACIQMLRKSSGSVAKIRLQQLCRVEV